MARKKREYIVLYFVHPMTKGRAKVRTPSKKAGLIRQIMTGAGYQEVGRGAYAAWVRRHPLAALEAGVLEDEID